MIEFKVVFNEEEQSHNSFAASQMPIVIGRAEDANVRVMSGIVSRHHAIVGHLGHRYVVVDISSGNGLGINDAEKVIATALSSGDVIHLGKYTVEIALHDEESASEQDRRGFSGAEDALMATMKMDEREMKGMTSRIKASLKMTKPKNLTWPLLSTCMWIGRDDACDILVKGLGIARKQALIYGAGNKHRIADLTMRGKVKVNRKRIDDVELARGDTITIGKAEFLYRT